MAAANASTSPPGDAPQPAGPAQQLGPRPGGAGQAYALLSLASFAWGANAVAGRVAIGEVSPMVLTSLRWVIVLGLFCLARPRRMLADLPVFRRYWSLGLRMGFMGYTAFSVALYIGAYYTTAVNLALLQGAIPVLVLLGALLFQGTRATPLQIVGVVVTLVGVLVIASAGDVAALFALSFNFGDLLLLGGTLFYAAYALMLRDRPPVPALTFFVLMAMGAFVSTIPLVAIEMLLGRAQFPTARGWAVIAFVALGPSLIAQLSFMRGVELIGPGRAGVFVNLTPVFGALLAVVLLGEAFGLHQAVALALVLGGILLAEHRMPTHSLRR